MISVMVSCPWQHVTIYISQKVEIQALNIYFTENILEYTK